MAAGRGEDDIDGGSVADHDAVTDAELLWVSGTLEVIEALAVPDDVDVYDIVELAVAVGMKV